MAEIGEQQHAAVDAPRRDQREILFQREIGDEGEEDDGHGAAGEHGEGKGADHPPPGAHAVFQLAVMAGHVAAREHPHDDAGNDEQRIDACGGVDDVGGDAEDCGHRARAFASATMPRARLTMVRAESASSTARRTVVQRPGAKPMPKRKPSSPKAKARSLLPRGPS